MSNNVVQHPRHDLKKEIDIVNTDEAHAFQTAIWKAVQDYADYLVANDLVFDPEPPHWWRDDRMKSLVIRHEFNMGTMMTLDGGVEHPRPSYEHEFFATMTRSRP